MTTQHQSPHTACTPLGDRAHANAAHRHRTACHETATPRHNFVAVLRKSNRWRLTAPRNQGGSTP